MNITENIPTRAHRKGSHRTALHHGIAPQPTPFGAPVEIAEGLVRSTAPGVTAQKKPNAPGMSFSIS